MNITEILNTQLTVGHAVGYWVGSLAFKVILAILFKARSRVEICLN